MSDLDARDRQGWWHAVNSAIGRLFKLSARLQHPQPRPKVDFTLPPPSDKPLILLLHGYQGAPGEFCDLYPYLCAALGDRFDVAVVDTLDPGMGRTPDENNPHIDRFLTTHGLSSRPLCLVGHSIGGLVARRYAQLADAGRVRAVVMIGTPNGGLRWWNLFPIHWSRARGFDLRFNAVTPPDPAVRYLVLAGTRGTNWLEGRPNDQAVGVWSALRLLQFAGDATVQTALYPLDHWELMRDETVARDIAAFLGQ